MAKTKGSPHNLYLETLFEFIGVSVVAAIANTNSQLGDAMVAFMVGILIIWFTLHASFFSNLINSASG